MMALAHFSLILPAASGDPAGTRAPNCICGEWRNVDLIQ
jgi:hypothetical protein